MGQHHAPLLFSIISVVTLPFCGQWFNKGHLLHYSGSSEMTRTWLFSSLLNHWRLALCPTLHRCSVIMCWQHFWQNRLILMRKLAMYYRQNHQQQHANYKEHFPNFYLEMRAGVTTGQPGVVQESSLMVSIRDWVPENADRDSSDEKHGLYFHYLHASMEWVFIMGKRASFC